MSDRKAAYRRAHMEQGVCDERGAVFYATAARLPNGAYGMCVLGVRGNLLSIYDTGSQAGVGQRLYTIPLNQVKEAATWVASSRRTCRRCGFRRPRFARLEVRKRRLRTGTPGKRSAGRSGDMKGLRLFHISPEGLIGFFDSQSRVCGLWRPTLLDFWSDL